MAEVTHEQMIKMVAQLNHYQLINCADCHKDHIIKILEAGGVKVLPMSRDVPGGGIGTTSEVEK